MELIDTAPQVKVDPAEYNRLLGFPRDYVLEGRSRELAEWAQSWYAECGRPWIFARQATSLHLVNDTIQIDGVSFTTGRLLEILSRAKADGAVLVAVGAGVEVDTETQRLWREEKPDEYFFLEMYGSAVAEHLVAVAGMRLCGWAEQLGMSVLPHYSPGYPEWDIADQPRLLDLVRNSLPHPIHVLDSGMLAPKKTLLAVFGLTHQTNGVRRLNELIPCSNCTLTPCEYRRTAAPAPKYQVNAKALRRWAAERLSLERHGDGAVDALFRYDGTTCNNMGQPLAFEYRVKLGPEAEGYPIREQHCAPASGDAGHRHMCKFAGGELLHAIEDEKPLAGRPLDEVIGWTRPVSMAGCYCEPTSREHKWGLVLETIHYALNHRQ
ncbi:MAG TPA: hypothetical protein VHW24_24065 [Bryobacteraceae bacterium]|jgi:hypothetical protein|nr:hypothetical protein [Bryobacteraceae bacterium]